MNTPTKWTATDLTGAKSVGNMRLNQTSILEFVDRAGDWHNFDLLKTPNRIVFGGWSNTGFIESGYLELEEGEHLDVALCELLEELQVYYDDGPQYVSRIVTNERM